MASSATIETTYRVFLKILSLILKRYWDISSMKNLWSASAKTIQRFSKLQMSIKNCYEFDTSFLSAPLD